MKEKYVLDGMYPDKSDIVVEAGAYHGFDTAMFAKLAKEVIAFEPSPRNHNKAKENLKRYDNITLINKGLWKEEDEIEIKYGTGSGDDGFLEPDSTKHKTGGKIPVDTIESYADRLGIDTIDYLKIEAEGAEPEIIEGINGIQIENIVVNVGEERDGRPNGIEVMKILQKEGYKLIGVERGHIAFFTSKELGHHGFANI